MSVPFPFTDLSQTKVRPAMVISNDTIKNTDDLIVVMITSQNKSDGVNIPIDIIQGSIPLPQNSYIRCHRLVSIENRLVVKKVSAAKPSL